MTLYLTDGTSPQEIDRGQAAGFVHGVKLYPAGATTHSDAGVTDIRKVHASLARMEEVGMPLQVHGETPGADVDVFDREAHFIDAVLIPLLERFPSCRWCSSTSRRRAQPNSCGRRALASPRPSRRNICCTIATRFFPAASNHTIIACRY